MGTYHEVVLRDSTGEFVARVCPGDYGFSVKVEREGGQFDTEVLPALITAASTHLGRELSSIWIDDMSGDGWDSVRWGDPPPTVPWDGPASLYEEPDLPYVYVIAADGWKVSDQEVPVIRLAFKHRPGCG